MLSTIFSNDVVSYNIEGKWIYSIFKNASSSLRDSTKERPIIRQQHKKLDDIYVYVREPYTRYYSGLSTFIELTHREINIPHEVQLQFIQHCNVVNRHYIEQFYWIVNLLRFLSESCTIHINDFSQIPLILHKTSINMLDICEVPVELRLDEILYKELVGKQLTKKEFIGYYKKNYPSLYNQTFGMIKELCSALD